MKKTNISNEELLRMASAGLRHLAKQIADEIAALAGKIETGALKPAPKKRHISPEGMAAIQAAQKRRWAKFRRAKGRAIVKRATSRRAA
jgi:hypothetical protein